MSDEEMEGTLPAEDPVTPNESKNKRKHTEEKGHKSSKKRKHAPDEKSIIEQEYGITPGQSDKKKKKKERKRREESLPSPETSQTKATTTSPVEQSPQEKEPSATTSITPPPSQTQQPTNPSQSGLTSSSYRTTRASLLLPLPPIAISTTTALSSLLAQHISPLLLTYHPPLKGIILSFSDAVLSSTQPTDAEAADPPPTSPTEPEDDSAPSDLQLAHCRDEHGVSFIWLTCTFLLFSPHPGDELSGYINIASDGFVGLITYNYFQVSIGKERIPKTWRWIESSTPSTSADTSKSRKKKGKTQKLRDEDSSPTPQIPPVDTPSTTATEHQDSTPDEEGSGFFTTDPTNPAPISGPVTYRVTDTELIPSGHAADKWTLRIQGTLLDEPDEQEVREAEKTKWEERERRRRDGKKGMTPLQQQQLAHTRRRAGVDEERGDAGGDVTMSGALGQEEGQLDAEDAVQTPVAVTTKKKHRKEY